MNPFKKITLYVLIIIFILFYCNSLFSQEQTVVKVKNIDYKNFDIALNGKVKSVMIITHGGEYSCDTIRPYFNDKIFEEFQDGVCWIVECKIDTLIYQFDTNLVISKIISNNFLVIKQNIGKIEKTEYYFTNGKIQSQKQTINGKKDKLIRYKYNSLDSLIKKTELYRNFKTIVYYKFDKRNNLIEKKEYLHHKNKLYWLSLRSKENYVYDSNNHLIQKKWAVHRIDVFKYDSLGNKTEEGYCRQLLGKKCIYSPLKSFEYDTNNRLTKSYFIGESNSERPYELFFYDFKGRLSETKTYSIQKDTILKNHIIFSYNENDKCIKKEAFIGRGYWNNGYYWGCKKVIFQYDQYGNIIQENCFDCIMDEVPEIIKYNYTYDSHGNWIKKETWMGKTKDKLERNKIEDRIIEYY